MGDPTLSMFRSSTRLLQARDACRRAPVGAGTSNPLLIFLIRARKFSEQQKFRDNIQINISIEAAPEVSPLALPSINKETSDHN